MKVYLHAMKIVLYVAGKLVEVNGLQQVLLLQY